MKFEGTQLGDGWSYQWISGTHHVWRVGEPYPFTFIITIETRNYYLLYHRAGGTNDNPEKSELFSEPSLEAYLAKGDEHIASFMTRIATNGDEKIINTVEFKIVGYNPKKFSPGSGPIFGY